MLQSLLSGPAEALMATTASWLLTYLACSTFVLAAAWLLDGRTPLARSPAARTDLWTAAVLAPVLAVLLQAATGLGPRVELRASEAEKVVAEFGAPPSGGDGATGDGVEVGAAAGGGPGKGAVPSALSAGEAIPSRAAAPPPTLRRPHRAERTDPGMWVRAVGHDWPFLLVVGWTVVAGLLVGLQLLAWGRLAWRLRDRTTIEAGPRRSDLDELLESIGRRRPVRLSRSEAVISPVALPGGEICLPDRRHPALGREEGRAVLAHELVHVRRGDTVRLLLLRLLERILFLQPLNRLALRRAEAASEDLSDAWVREQGMGRSLAGSLVTVARWIRADRRSTGLAGLARTPAVERRVRRLIEPAATGEAAVRPGRAALAGLALVGLLLVGVPAVEVDTPAHAIMLSPDSGPGAPTASVPSRVDRAVADRERELGAVASLLGDQPEVVRERLVPLLGRDGGSLGVRLQGAAGPVSLALRPGGDDIRLVGPGGRSATLEPPTAGASDGWVGVLRARGARPGRWELHLPASVRRLALVVGGRQLRTPGPLAGGELPRIISLR